jgi:hypothetical protein
MDKRAFAVYGSILMSIPTSRPLHIALSNDLNKKGSKPATKVVDDAARKIFTVNKDGAILEFAHKQPDSAYWNGVKYYGSGTRTKIRLPRTQTEAAAAPGITEASPASPR